MAPTQLSAERHSVENKTSDNPLGHLPHIFPVLFILHEFIPSHVSFPVQQYPSGHLIIVTESSLASLYPQ